jgi:hypothetical protein
MECAYYWIENSPDGTSQVAVGPYNTLAQCRDMLGSALYSHPWACHIYGPNGPPDTNCEITGNGFGYPEDWPYPATTTMPSSDCSYLIVGGSLPTGAPANATGSYFLSGSSNSQVVLLPKGNGTNYSNAVAAEATGGWVGYYHDMSCPGAPYFGVGVDNACN